MVFAATVGMVCAAPDIQLPGGDAWVISGSVIQAALKREDRPAREVRLRLHHRTTRSGVVARGERLPPRTVIDMAPAERRRTKGPRWLRRRTGKRSGAGAALRQRLASGESVLDV